jgi:molybdopterin-dependent oxidoreductase alpha subunit
MDDDDRRLVPYGGPAGGWGSVRSVVNVLSREGVLLAGNAMLMRQNKSGGFVCVSCGWSKPSRPRLFEYCENGAKATAWEMTRKRAGPEFFKSHRVADLETWPDHDLEEQGRLTHPMRWDADSDTYLPVTWSQAFEEIGKELKSLTAESVVFYASGRASLETSYLWQLFARLYGCNNLPDSSNMCHESTSVALPESIGVPVGTVTLDDFAVTDCILFFGQNVGSNSPRMLHPLQEAVRRGVPVITFNPLRERGLERFTNPQSPSEMLTGAETAISSQYHQVKPGGDLAAIYGMAKALLALDDAALATGQPRVLDVAFVAEHCHDFAAFEISARSQVWAELERQSGLTRAAMEIAATVYARSPSAIGVFGMGLTQHRTGVENVQMLMNLLLMRGNIGRPGAGICPVRGHSNVQGQRTVGITEKPELAPLDKLKELYGFEPPRNKGLNTVEACEGILNGTVNAFLGLGGNFIRAIPETVAMETAWRKMRLTVQVSTKLNRSHLIHGKIAYILPCLGRIERDEQASGLQVVTNESSTAHIHSSRGTAAPASSHLLSEPAIIAGLAKASLASNSKVNWDRWISNYAHIRSAIEATYPDIFHDFNSRIDEPGGFHRYLPARHRVWKTPTGKANFLVPGGLDENPDTSQSAAGAPILQLISLRSNDQFNTSIYGYDDRFRGVRNTRLVLFMNTKDIHRLGFVNDAPVDVVSEAGDDVRRVVKGLRILAYDIPEGCCGAYYPECNPLIPVWHYASRAKVPAAKSIPVSIHSASN